MSDRDVLRQHYATESLDASNQLDADTGRHLGNFPQAFSHLACLEAGARIIMAERLREYMS